MQLIRTADEMRAWSRAARARGERVGFVPTMGFLHEGHLGLMRIAGERAEAVVASIFVNPTQFAPGEALDRYPRDEEGDLAGCREVGCHAVFLPSVEEMYPAGAQTFVTVEQLSGGLCGTSRPTHFRGVATVVSLLFNVVEPDVAVFGAKDFQQLRVIEQMVRDLRFPIEIVGGPIVREPDGLAMSSRNAYLQPDERAQAPVLREALLAAAARVAAEGGDAGAVRAAIRARIETQPLAAVDYIDVVDRETLEPLSGPVVREARAAVAVEFGATRLIDNIALLPPSGGP